MLASKSLRRTLLAVLSVLMFGALLTAQSTTDGAISGTVFDANGAVIPKAQVSIRNNGTNAEQTAVADDSGYFRATALKPGSYTVSINHTGFAVFKATDVIVQVGSVTDLSPHLKVAGASETVEVTAEAPQINYTSPEFAPTLNQVAIENLPINGGRWSSFAMLTPGVVSNGSGFGLLSFRGISVLLNNNTVDGADNNQAFFSEERGRTRAGYSTPKIAIQEFQVNTSNYSSEYGRSAGGVVNTVTKSGTNNLHGEAYFYDRDNVWGATNPFTKLQVQQTPGVFTPVPFKPTDWRKMFAFQVGGPLVKNKLFWSLSYDWYHRNFPGLGVASSPQVFFASPTTATITAFAQHLNGLPGNVAPTPAQIADASTKYSTDLTNLNTMLGLVPRTGAQNIIFPKLDWQINAKNIASFTFNRMRWSSPAGIQTQSTNTNGIASFGDDFVKDTWGIAKLDTMFTPYLSNQVRFQYGRDFEYEFSQKPTPYEMANLVNSPTFTNPLRLPPQVSITNGFTFGVPTFLQRPSFPDETRIQVTDTFTWIKGKHTFKFGVDGSRVDDLSQNLRTQFGSYSYSNLLNYFSDLHVPHGCATSNTVAPTLPCYSNFSQAFGPLGFEFQTHDYAVFVGDDWKILNRLSLSLGLRWEYEALPSPFNGLANPAIPQSGRLPNDMNNFGPRAGFAWNVRGNGKTVLRGGYGLYYGRIINSSIFSALTGTAMPGSQVTFSFSPSTTSPVFPTILAAAPPPSPTARPNVTFFDSNFQAPQIHQFDLIVEQDLGWGTVLKVSYLGSLGRELPNFGDINICTSAAQPGCAAAAPRTVTYQVLNGGPIKTSTLSETVYSGRPAGTQFGTMTDIFSGVNSSYHALSVQVDHRFSKHVQFNVNYTWAHAIDQGQNETTFADFNDLLVPNNLAADKGNSIYDVRHRFVVSAVMDSPWKKTGWVGFFTNDWRLSPIFQFQTGLPYSLGTAGSPPSPTVGSGINGSFGAARIDVTGRNTFRFPSTYVQDLRLSKSFTYRERYGLELSADVFNLANHTNYTGVNTTGYSLSSSGTVATPSGNVACGNGIGVNPLPCLNFNTSGPTPASGSPFAPVFGSFTSANSNFIYSPRQLQLGVRVRF